MRGHLRAGRGCVHQHAGDIEVGIQQRNEAVQQRRAVLFGVVVEVVRNMVDALLRRHLQQVLHTNGFGCRGCTWHVCRCAMTAVRWEQEWYSGQMCAAQWNMGGPRRAPSG